MSIQNEGIKSKNIALVGNPNCGKTLIFNNLTDGHQHVGNWTGVTVEKKVGHIPGDKSLFFVDLPGIYSLSPYSQEEIVTREYISSDNPDLVLNVIDASNLERNLYLTTQILETGKPTILILNMMDLAKRKGLEINTSELSKKLGVPVVTSIATKKEQTHIALDEALIHAGIDHVSVHKGKSPAKCSGCTGCDTSETCTVVDKSNLKPLTPKVLEKIFSGDTEKILNEITNIIKPFVPENRERYYSVKILEKDKITLSELEIPETDLLKIKHIIAEFEENKGEDSAAVISTERYEFVESIIASTVKKVPVTSKNLTEKIDKIVTNKWLALPIFIAVMFLIYYIAISSIGALLTDFVNENIFGELVPNALTAGLDAINAPTWANQLIVDGIAGGVGAVLGFVPQIMILFFLLSFLEDSGYMARIAFILDRIFRVFGLSGKSIIPIMIGTGCGVPGIMATKTIENESDRKISIITTTFIPCSAKLPVIALISGAFFGNAFWVAGISYFIGIFGIIISALILKKASIFRKDISPFVMELPEYHLPRLKSLTIHMWGKGKMFIKRAGTIILAACIIIWFLSSFNFRLQMVDTEDSILASIGSYIAVIFEPIGFGNWRATAATITGLIAKENLVGTLGVLYSNASEFSENGMEFWDALRASYAPMAGFSLLVFNLLCAPCFAAIGSIYKEMNSIRWTFFAVLYQCLFAYAIALIIYQVSLFVTTGSFTILSAVTLLIIITGLFLIFRRPSKSDLGFGLHRHAE